MIKNETNKDKSEDISTNKKNTKAEKINRLAEKLKQNLTRRKEKNNSTEN